MTKAPSFKDFYIDNYGSLFRFVRSILRAGEEVEDIVQESFYRLYKIWGTIADDDHARAWIFSVARNLSIDKLKSPKHEPDTYLATCSSEDFLHEELALQEALRMLEAAIAALPPQTGKVAALAYSGKQNQEIARLLGMSVNSVKTLKKEAYKKLRNTLDAKYLLLIISIFAN